MSIAVLRGGPLPAGSARPVPRIVRLLQLGQSQPAAAGEDPKLKSMRRLPMSNIWLLAAVGCIEREGTVVRRNRVVDLEKADLDIAQVDAGVSSKGKKEGADVRDLGALAQTGLNQGSQHGSR